MLTDAVGAVTGLILDGGIPPRVEMDHIVGCGEVKAQSTSLETDEEEGDITLLILLHQADALLG